MKLSFTVIFTLSLLTLSSQSYSMIAKGSVEHLEPYTVYADQSKVVIKPQVDLPKAEFTKTVLPKSDLQKVGEKLIKESFQSFRKDNKAAIKKSSSVSILDGVKAPSKEAKEILRLTEKVERLDNQVKSTELKNKDLSSVVVKQKKSLEEINEIKQGLLKKVKSQRKSLVALENELGNSKGYSEILLKEVYQKAEVAAKRLLENGKLLQELNKAEVKLQNSIKSKNQEVKELQKISQGFFKDNLKLKNAYDNLSKELNNLSSFAAQINEEKLEKSRLIQDLLAKGILKDENTFQLKVAIKEYRRKLPALKDENKKLSDQNIALTKENKNLTTELQETTCEKDKAIHDLAAEMSAKVEPILSEITKIENQKSKDSNVIELIKPEAKVIATKENTEKEETLDELKEKVASLEEELEERKDKRKEAKEKLEKEDDDLFANDKFAKQFSMMAKMMRFMPSMYGAQNQMPRQQVVRQVTQTTSSNNNNYMNQYMQMMMMKQLMGQKTGFSMYDPYSASQAVNTQDFFGGYSLMPGVIPMAERKGGAFNFNILNT